jgi:hypothetical protein
LEQQESENQRQAELLNLENQRKAELKNRNTEIITKFIVEHVEPLLEEQAVSCLSKTYYVFVPSSFERTAVMNIIPEDKNIVEGFGGNQAAGSFFISNAGHKEYIKVIRLTGQEYGLEFWKQPEVLEELNHTLKSRLQANGEKVAQTKPESVGGVWEWGSFFSGVKLSPGYTGVEFQMSSKVIFFYAVIA